MSWPEFELWSTLEKNKLTSGLHSNYKIAMTVSLHSPCKITMTVSLHCPDNDIVLLFQRFQYLQNRYDGVIAQPWKRHRPALSEISVLTKSLWRCHCTALTTTSSCSFRDFSITATPDPWSFRKKNQRAKHNAAPVPLLFENLPPS